MRSSDKHLVATTLAFSHRVSVEVLAAVNNHLEASNNLLEDVHVNQWLASVFFIKIAST